MEDLTEVITSAQFHPSHCHIMLHSSSKGTIKIGDLRAGEKESLASSAYRLYPPFTQNRSSYHLHLCLRLRLLRLLPPAALLDKQAKVLEGPPAGGESKSFFSEIIASGRLCLIVPRVCLG